MSNTPELREAIAKRIYLWMVRYTRDENNYNETKWAAIPEKDRKYWRKYYADQILHLLQSERMVRLADDQNLLKNKYADRPNPPVILFDAEHHEQAQLDRDRVIARYAYEEAQQDMLKAGFRKVEEIDIEDEEENNQET